MNDLFIRGIKINFKGIEESSYVKDIKSIENTKELIFNKNVTFLPGKTEAENQHYLKRLLSITDLIPKEEARTSAFQQMILIRTYIKI